LPFALCGICGKIADPFRIPKREPKCAARAPSRLKTWRDISRHIHDYYAMK